VPTNAPSSWPHSPRLPPAWFCPVSNKRFPGYWQRLANRKR